MSQDIDFGSGSALKTVVPGLKLQKGLFRGVLTWWHSREVKPSTASLACLHPDSVQALLAPTSTARYYTNHTEQFL